VSWGEFEQLKNGVEIKDWSTSMMDSRWCCCVDLAQLLFSCAGYVDDRYKIKTVTHGGLRMIVRRGAWPRRSLVSIDVPVRFGHLFECQSWSREQIVNAPQCELRSADMARTSDSILGCRGKNASCKMIHRQGCRHFSTIEWLITAISRKRDQKYVVNQVKVHRFVSSTETLALRF
jgi:hypothetical protein